jgi:hypothetical protein
MTLFSCFIIKIYSIITNLLISNIQSNGEFLLLNLSLNELIPLLETYVLSFKSSNILYNLLKLLFAITILQLLIDKL